MRQTIVSAAVVLIAACGGSDDPSGPDGGQTPTLNALWVESASDVYAVGDAGTILHYNGSVWTQESSGTTKALYAIGKVGATYVTVGADGTMLARTGAGWGELPSPTANTLYGIGEGTTSIAAVGEAGTVVIYTPNVNITAQNAGVNTDLFATGGESPSDIIVAGAGGVVRLLSGGTWTSFPSGTTNALRGGSGNDNVIIIVGDNGTIVKANNGPSFGFDPIASGTTRHLRSAVGNPTDFFVVGDGGTVLHSGSTATTWTPQSLGATTDLRSVDMSTQTDVFAVGAGGAIFHYNGTSWTKQR